MVTITLPQEYGYVLMVALTLCLQTTLTGFFVGGAARKDAFHYEVVGDFEDEHEKAFGKGSKISK